MTKNAHKELKKKH